MAVMLLELLVAAAMTVLIKAGTYYAGHWVAWQVAAAVAVVIVVGGQLLVDVPDMHRWWR